MTEQDKIEVENIIKRVLTEELEVFERQLKIKEIVGEEIINLFSFNKFNFKKQIKLGNAINIQTSRGSGTKLGTASDQLLGFWGVTPVDQPAAVADASIASVGGANTVDQGQIETNFTNLQTAVNAIIARLEEIGIIST